MSICSACDVDLCELCGHHCECHHLHVHQHQDHRPRPAWQEL